MEKADKHRYRINKADSDNVLYLCVGFEDEDGIYASIYNNVQSNMCVDNNKANADNECAADTFAAIKEMYIHSGIITGAAESFSTMKMKNL